MEPIRAAVTGLGAITGFGAGAEVLWTALLDGRRAVELQPSLREIGLEVGPVALISSLALDRPGRAAELAVAAAREAFRQSGEPLRGARLGVVCGTTLGDIGGWLRAVRFAEGADHFTHAAPAQAVADALGAEGPVEVISNACASGNSAIGAALDLVQEGRCDVVVAGGVDVLSDFVISGFAALKALDPGPCRPFDRQRRGLNLGEGACFLVIEAEAHARARAAPVRAFLSGYGLAADATHMTGPDREGRGAARAMTAALADAGLDASSVGFVSAHGTATVFNDLMEFQALKLVLGKRVGSTPINSIKGSLGHTLGAAGALEALVCVRALETGFVPPTTGLDELDPEIGLDVVRDSPRRADPQVALSTSSGFGGVNAAVVFTND